MPFHQPASDSDGRGPMPVDHAWYSRGYLGDGITLLEELRVDQRVRGNFFLVEGDDDNLLVDAGLGLASLRNCLPDVFERPVKLFLTHAHYDHQGGAYELSSRIAHAAEADALADPPPAKLRATDFVDEVRAALSRQGRMPLPASMLTAHPRADFDPDRFRIVGTTPTQLVEEGDTIEIGPRRFTVVHLPGHTDGSIGLIEEATGIFFSGDAIYDGPILDFLPRSDVDDYVRTMERMKELDVRLVLGGHGPPLTRPRMLELIDEYLRTKEAGNG